MQAYVDGYPTSATSKRIRSYKSHVKTVRSIPLLAIHRRFDKRKWKPFVDHWIASLPVAPLTGSTVVLTGAWVYAFDYGEGE